jgi:hypothetical protein
MRIVVSGVVLLALACGLIGQSPAAPVLMLPLLNRTSLATTMST